MCEIILLKLYPTKEDKEHPKKTIQLTPAQRKAAIQRIAQAAQNNPEFKAKVDNEIAEAKAQHNPQETYHFPKLPLTDQTYKELRTAIRTGQVKWKELPTELNHAYQRFGREEREAEWKKIQEEFRIWE